MFGGGVDLGAGGIDLDGGGVDVGTAPDLLDPLDCASLADFAALAVPGDVRDPGDCPTLNPGTWVEGDRDESSESAIFPNG